MTNTELLKALGDVDERFLTEEYAPAANKKQRVTKAVRYAFAAAAACALITVCAAVINNTRPGPAAPDKTAARPQIITENDVIVFGSDDRTGAESPDIDGKPVKTDIVSQFEFMQNIKLPKEYVLTDQWILYEKENPQDTAYSKPWQYEVLYAVPREKGDPGEITESVDIIFTKEEIIGCILPDKNTFPISRINGKEVYLYKSENDTGIKAFFESGGYEFYVSSAGLGEDEFVGLVQSVLK